MMYRSKTPVFHGYLARINVNQTTLTCLFGPWNTGISENLGNDMYKYPRCDKNPSGKSFRQSSSQEIAHSNGQSHKYRQYPEMIGTYPQLAYQEKWRETVVGKEA
uniref:Uncharacterized protein n=1 Tax=Candidatus Kentrum sp. DK TaxID=2126562 RepID=A0A450SEL2_9GAMM|nr:MAG: hypothetical protein BECKDK2373C_GA0170839_103126 [Candidatus Kentron sp. DK]